MAEALWRASAVDLAAGIREKRFSCVEAMTSVVERIRGLNPGLNAIVFDYTEEALAEAARADAELAAGAGPGPLHGVPVTIKENVDQQGKPTPNGLPAFANVIAPDDAPLVAESRRPAPSSWAARTRRSCRCAPRPTIRCTGARCNPWHPDASPGGSSGGAGAAAAAGFGPIHHGNDIGGSLRFPAFAYGLATVKPTPGRIPAFNPSATAERGMLAQLMSVQGAICREVRDVRLATRVMAEPRSRAIRGGCRRRSTARPSRGRSASRVTRNSHGYPMHPEIAAPLERAAGWLADAGYAVEEVEPPPIIEPARGWFTVRRSPR